MADAHNLFAALPNSPPEGEAFETLLERAGVRVERIVSFGHGTPAGQWLEQDADEWVVVLRGAARLVFEEPAEVVEMGVGEHLLIEAGRRHRVEWTTPGEPTVWLAVHVSG